MDDTATRESGPVDASTALDDIVNEIAAGDEGPTDGLDAVVEELVNEAEGQGEADEAPPTEDDATDPAEQAEETPTEDSPEEPLHTVKVNGEERQVPLSELLKGYSRTEDYKAKTAAVAEERRQVEAERQRVGAEEAAKYANQLEEATNLFAQYDPVLQEAAKIDWAELKRTNPAAFVQAQDAVQERYAAIQQMQAQAQAVRQQATQQQQAVAEQERVQRFDAAAEKIIADNPELADEAKFKEFAGSAVETLKGYGFAPEQIVDVLDDRVLRLADDARKWRAHEAAQKSLPEKRVVPKSQVKSLQSDGLGSRATKPRFPANASRDQATNWIANQILSEG